MNFIEFREKSFPEKSVFHRGQFDFTTNCVKWLALRFAYVLYCLKFSANFLNVISLSFTFAGMVLLHFAPSHNVNYALVGMLFIYFQVFIDFVDGPIAKAQEKTSKIGHAFDDLGCDLTRVALLLLIGLFTESNILALANIFSGVILMYFLPKTSPWFPENGFGALVKKFYVNKISLIGVRFMMGVLPAGLVFVIMNEWDVAKFSLGISYIYNALAVFWLLMCIPNHEHK